MLKKKADRYSHELYRTLTAAPIHGYEWEMNHYLFGEQSVCVDVVGIPVGATGPHILIEAEIHREDPASNVLKIWKALHDHQKDAVMFHVFCKAYQDAGSKRRRADFAKFVGDRMQQETGCPYNVIKSTWNPRKNSPKGGGKVLDHAREDAQSIISELNRLIVKRKRAAAAH